MVPFADPLAALDRIPDPRRRQGRRYPLAHLLLFSVLAVLAGATSYRGILVFIAVHRERLNAVFGAALRAGARPPAAPGAGRQHAARPVPGARPGRAGGRLPPARRRAERRGAGGGAAGGCAPRAAAPTPL